MADSILDYVQLFEWTEGAPAAGELDDLGGAISTVDVVPPNIVFGSDTVAVVGDEVYCIINTPPNISIESDTVATEYTGTRIVPIGPPNISISAIPVIGPAVPVVIPNIVFGTPTITAESFVPSPVPDIAIEPEAITIEYTGTLIVNAPAANIVISAGSFYTNTSNAPTWTIGNAVFVTPPNIAITTVIPTVGEVVNLVNVPNIAITSQGAGPVVIVETSLQDTFFAWDNASAGWLMTIAEALQSTDAAQAQLDLLIKEYLAARDATIGNTIGTLSVEESITAADAASILHIFSETVSDVLSAVDTATPIITVLVAEWLRLKDEITSQGTFNAEISETITSIDSVLYIQVLSLIESLSIADVNTLTAFITELINESVSVVDVLSGLGIFTKTVSETVAAEDTTALSVVLALMESLVGADTVTAVNTIITTLSEQFSAVDVLTNNLNIAITVDDAIVVVDTASATGILYNTITEGVKLNVYVTIDSDVYECFVLNTPKFLASLYSGFDFNSYCEFEGRAFAANATGIYELTGSTDAGADIHSGVVLSESNFGVANKKRFRKAYLGVTGNTPVMLMETEDGERLAYTVSDNGTVEASRELKSKSWVLSVADFETLDFMNLIPLALTKGR